MCEDTGRCACVCGGGRGGGRGRALSEGNVLMAYARSQSEKKGNRGAPEADRHVGSRGGHQHQHHQLQQVLPKRHVLCMTDTAPNESGHDSNMCICSIRKEVCWRNVGVGPSIKQRASNADCIAMFNSLANAKPAQPSARADANRCIQQDFCPRTILLHACLRQTDCRKEMHETSINICFSFSTGFRRTIE